MMLGCYEYMPMICEQRTEKGSVGGEEEGAALFFLNTFLCTGFGSEDQISSSRLYLHS